MAGALGANCCGGTSVTERYYVFLNSWRRFGWGVFFCALEGGGGDQNSEEMLREANYYMVDRNCRIGEDHSIIWPTRPHNQKKKTQKSNINPGLRGFARKSSVRDKRRGSLNGQPLYPYAHNVFNASSIGSSSSTSVTGASVSASNFSSASAAFEANCCFTVSVVSWAISLA